MFCVNLVSEQIQRNNLKRDKTSATIINNKWIKEKKKKSAHHDSIHAKWARNVHFQYTLQHFSSWWFSPATLSWDCATYSEKDVKTYQTQRCAECAPDKLCWCNNILQYTYSNTCEKVGICRPPLFNSIPFFCMQLNLLGDPFEAISAVNTLE